MAGWYGKSLQAYCTIGLIAAGLLASGAAARDVSLHGAASVGDDIVLVGRAEIEGNLGGHLRIVTNGSRNGLLDLAQGRAELAMTATDLATLRQQIELQAPGSLRGIELVEHKVASAEIRFIAHPDNPVRQLSRSQVAAILAGTIVDWREVGGEAGRIEVFAEAPGSAIRATLEQHWLQARAIVTTGHRKTTAQLAAAVAERPRSFGYILAGDDAGAVSVIDGVSAVQALYLVTRGQPDEFQRRLIAAVRRAAGGHDEASHRLVESQ